MLFFLIRKFGYISISFIITSCHVVLWCPTGLFVGFTNTCEAKRACVCDDKCIRCPHEDNLCLKMTLVYCIAFLRSYRSLLDKIVGQLRGTTLLESLFEMNQYYFLMPSLLPKIQSSRGICFVCML